MNHSYQFFENKECQYFPCHEGLENFNCLFCYCPLYHLENCLGTPTFKEKQGKMIKVCTNCTFPHVPEHYDDMINKLREN